ncbi:MAG: hypothetical protein Q7J35_11585 [Candidatus Methanoperedens sp.]|nr:hypothetical protein [Candidatus Methanoperedens sp.]
MDTNTVTALATVVLAVITIWYAISTYRLLEETQVTRKVAFIEKRLEKLYYPLRDVLQNPFTDVFLGGEKVKNINLKKIDDIIPFQYLASKELENPLNQFFKKALDERYIYGYESGNDYKPYEIVDDEIKKKVNEDIDNLKNELKKLVKLSD